MSDTIERRARILFDAGLPEDKARQIAIETAKCRLSFSKKYFTYFVYTLAGRLVSYYIKDERR